MAHEGHVGCAKEGASDGMEAAPTIMEDRFSPLETAVLGLCHAGLTDYREIARHAGSTPAAVEAICESSEPRIRLALRRGIAFRAHLACPLRCEGCGQSLTSVPCLACGIYWPHGTATSREPPLARRAAPQPLPGSRAKVNLMARRASRGEAIFHPHDRRQPPPRTKIEIQLCRIGDIQAAALED